MFRIYADGEILYYPSDKTAIVLAPKLSLEMGKTGSLTFRMPPTNALYNSIRKLKTIVTVEYRGVEIFRGRVLSADKDFDNIKEVYCEGNLAYLVDSVQTTDAYRGSTHDLFRRIIAAHNARMEPEKQFTVGQITVEDREVIIAGQSDEIEDLETDSFNYRQIAINATAKERSKTLDYINSNLVEYCGGYLRTRQVGDTTYIDYVQSYGNTAVQEIEFGVNMLDLVEESTPNDFFTVLIPIGDENLTIEDVNDGSDELVDQAAVALYGRIIETRVFESVNDPNTLKENGLRYLQSHANIPATVTVKAVDLNFIDPNVKEIYLGDIVHVCSAPNGIMENMTCSRMEYDLENPANNEYTFGVPKQTLTERYRKDRRKSDDNAERAAASGGGGGAKKAGEETKKLFDEWIDVDPNEPDGHVSLGALWREYKDDKEILKHKVGIDFNAIVEPGVPNIDIYSMYNIQNEQGEQITQQGITLRGYQEETRASLVLQVARGEELDEKIDGSYAQIRLELDEIEGSLVELNADKVAINTDITTINDTLGDLSINIASFERALTTITSDIVTLNTGQFNINENIDGVESSIASINSDITSINSRITQVRNLIAESIEATKADISWLNSKAVSVGSLYVSGTISANAIKLRNGGPEISWEDMATRQWVWNQHYVKWADANPNTVTTETINVLKSFSPASTEDVTFLVVS